MKKRTIEDAFFIYKDYEHNHDANYAHMIEVLGLENITPHIPFTREQIINALLFGDKFLKTLDLSIWTKATGITVDEIKPPYIFDDWFFTLILEHDPTIEVVSQAQIICTLKRAAQLWVEDELNVRKQQLEQQTRENNEKAKHSRYKKEDSEDSNE